MTEKSSKYLEAVIYNLETSLQEEDQTDIFQKTNLEVEKDFLAYKLKRMTYLIKFDLQYCALLS
jgi:hypothetical protein